MKLDLGDRLRIGPLYKVFPLEWYTDERFVLIPRSRPPCNVSNAHYFLRFFAGEIYEALDHHFYERYHDEARSR
jgi:hypothetical protein